MNSPEPAVTQITVPLALIVASLTNPRKSFTAEAMAELAESVKTLGVLQPMLVRPLPEARKGTVPAAALYEIVAGERRFRAATAAMLNSVPVVIRDLSDADVLRIQLIENLQREDLSPLEEATGYRTIMDQSDTTTDQLAEQIGKSRGYIYGRLKLLALADTCKQALRDGKIDASVALLIARIPLPSEQDRCLTLLTNTYSFTGVTARAAKNYIQNAFMRAMDRATFPLDNATLVPFAGACNTCPKRTSVNRELFGDISADVCTDPACMQAKDAAHKDQGVQALRDAGHTVLSVEDSAPHLSAQGYTTRNDSPYHTVSDDGPDGHEETWKDLIGDASGITFTYMQGKEGNLVKCALRTELEAALADGRIKFPNDDKMEDDQYAADEEDDDDTPDHNKNQLDSPKNVTWKAMKEANDLLIKQGKVARGVGGQIVAQIPDAFCRVGGADSRPSLHCHALYHRRWSG